GAPVPPTPAQFGHRYNWLPRNSRESTHAPAFLKPGLLSAFPGNHAIRPNHSSLEEKRPSADTDCWPASCLPTCKDRNTFSAHRIQNGACENQPPGKTAYL